MPFWSLGNSSKTCSKITQEQSGMAILNLEMGGGGKRRGSIESSKAVLVHHILYDDMTIIHVQLGRGGEGRGGGKRKSTPPLFLPLNQQYAILMSSRLWASLMSVNSFHAQIEFPLLVKTCIELYAWNNIDTFWRSFTTLLQFFWIFF